jgi:hypothetical protein
MRSNASRPSGSRGDDRSSAVGASGHPSDPPRAGGDRVIEQGERGLRQELVAAAERRAPFVGHRVDAVPRADEVTTSSTVPDFRARSRDGAACARQTRKRRRVARGASSPRKVGQRSSSAMRMRSGGMRGIVATASGDGTFFLS